MQGRRAAPFAFCSSACGPLDINPRWGRERPQTPADYVGFETMGPRRPQTPADCVGFNPRWGRERPQTPADCVGFKILVVPAARRRREMKPNAAHRGIRAGGDLFTFVSWFSSMALRPAAARAPKKRWVS